MLLKESKNLDSVVELLDRLYGLRAQIEPVWSKRHPIEYELDDILEKMAEPYNRLRDEMNG